MNHGMRQGQSWRRGDQGRTSGGARPLAVGLILLAVGAVEAATCPYDDDHLVLENLTIDGSETFRACLTITAGSGVTVSATGDATFQAGERIVLRPGFRVQAGGLLVARIGLSAGPLNDTGIDWCANADTNDLPCPVIIFRFPGQDGDHGRDALARDGQLPKVGGGNAGFDFTKLDANGNALPASASSWSCVRDNHTSLIWEVKTTSGLRSMDNTYTWYDPNSPDGNPGVPDGGNCTGSSCDTDIYVQAVNAQGLCGASDWRMPTWRELQGIVDYGRSDPAIDTGYFPNTPRSVFWSASPSTRLVFGANTGAHTWTVHFYDGEAGYNLRSISYRVRLVRGGP